MDKRLLEIQKRREDKARSNFQKKKQKFEQARDSYEEINRQVEEYKVWREEEAERIFSNIENQQISVKEIQNYQNKITHWKQEEVGLQQERSKKKVEKNVAENEQNMAYNKFLEKQKKHEKFKIIKERNDKLDKKHRLKLSDAEEEETNELFVSSKKKD